MYAEGLDIRMILGIVASLLITVGLLPYIWDIHYERAHPQILSWTGWGFITAIGAVAMFSVGFNFGALVVFANSIACFSIAIYAAFRRTGVWTTSAHDYVFFALGCIGVVLWQTFDNPDLAIVFAILADLSFGIPNIIKVYKNPKSETIFPWAMAMLSDILTLFIIDYVSFTEVAYPVYLAIYDSTILLLILIPIFLSKWQFEK